MDGLGMIALRFYPIKGDKLKELTKYIEQAHQEKLIEYKKNKEWWEYFNSILII